MTPQERQDRYLVRQRAKFWESLPMQAYRVRRLTRKQRGLELEPGEREELELTVQRVAEKAMSLGFVEVGAVATRLTDLLWRERHGAEVHRAIEHHCDALDSLIDDMSIEALATGLHSLGR